MVLIKFIKCLSLGPLESSKYKKKYDPPSLQSLLLKQIVRPEQKEQISDPQKCLIKQTPPKLLEKGGYCT